MMVVELLFFLKKTLKRNFNYIEEYGSLNTYLKFGGKI